MALREFNRDSIIGYASAISPRGVDGIPALTPEWECHTCHILPPSEIDWGLFWAVFTGSEGRHLFHRIG